MTQIGHFTRTPAGYAGHIRTLAIDVTLTLVPADASDAENAPLYRIHRGDEEGPEVGAAWSRVGEKAGDYLAFQLDDPTFEKPIRANLFRSGDDGDAWTLHWNRPTKRADAD